VSHHKYLENRENREQTNSNWGTFSMNIAVLMLENHFLVNVLLMCGTICHQILLTSVRYAHLKGQLQ